MSAWNNETGYYRIPSTLWELENRAIPDNAPDIWLSRPGGKHHLGISFHFPPFNFPEGYGIIENYFNYFVSPFMIHVEQDSYNSWGVRACLTKYLDRTCFEYWNWLPGISIIDTSAKYTLPDSALAAFAGTEWADNDQRIFNGLYDSDIFFKLIRKYIELANRLTGPGWASWPFGQRQLAEAVIIWINPEINLPDVLLLASVRQHGVKYSYLDRRLYYPGDKLGGWEEKPDGWDCRQAIRFIYQASLMIDDGLPEMALSAAVAALENATAEILLFVLDNNYSKVERELKDCKFLSRFDRLLPKYGIILPKDLFEALKLAYFARNGVIHGLRPLSTENSAIHLNVIKDVIKWYWENVGDGAVKSKHKFIDPIPF